MLHAWTDTSGRNFLKHLATIAATELPMAAESLAATKKLEEICSNDFDGGIPFVVPRARRAIAGANLAVRGLPSDFAAVEREYAENVSRPTAQSAEILSDSQIDNLLYALGEGGGARHGWTTPDNAHDLYPPRAGRAPLQPDDTQDRISEILDVLGDLEANLASADGMISEVATSVDSAAEEVQVLKEATAGGMAGMRSDIQMLAAQVSSLHTMLNEIVVKIDGLAAAGRR